MNPELETKLAGEGKKGCALIALAFIMVVIVLSAIPAKLLGKTFIPEAICAGMIVFAVGQFSRRMALTRTAFARNQFKSGDMKGVLETLAPFLRRGPLWSHHVFDRNGEALTMLMKALKSQGRSQESEQLGAFIQRRYKGLNLEDE